MNFNKNDKQRFFNDIKGTISELNDDEKYCNLTLNVGHENPREVNLAVKKQDFENIKQDFKVGDKVSVRFYLVSRRNKNEKWFTNALLLEIEMDY